MTPDELLDAHSRRMQSDPGYAAIWSKATALPNMQLITAMLAWAEQADGLRAVARAGSDDAGWQIGVKCPYCGVRFGVQITPPATPQTNH